ncbi:DUF427 domain-containing protein [Streptomyces sp. DSM 42041]|uniref:DUF427 domain-containing protein n=1 Tax=Streptomyces hazeniae TaxID=3075538 RepID=A0ABU2NKV9_9ACTN|nr:DUF427 domain-containing protein [Streptomyces sp. DSM 42041]MDT0377626.1 DUF427 domain-containing protein [Streptomyces sp. DSM 42041]
MSLTLPGGPLARRSPDTVNYRVDGPAHRLFQHSFPRRVRAHFGGRTVLDSVRGALLHETGLPPQLYVPREDVDDSLLTATDHRTHCPFKGDARYYSVTAGDRTAENAFWHYPDPLPEARWLAGLVAPYFDRMDAWFDEDEEIHGHLRDPYHRVDVRPTSRDVRVVADGVEIAATRHAMLLSETGLPNRYYVPRRDVRVEHLEPSATHTVCPYKGRASYRSLRVGALSLPDTVFWYPEPLQDAVRVADHLCFHGEGVETRVDGEVAG